jgi:hypothetical protein
LENNSPDVIHPETDGPNSGTAAESSHAKPGGKRPTSTGNASKQETDTKGSAQAALEEEQRQAAAAQAAVEDLQRRLAAVEAALAEERQKAIEAQQALAEQRQATETHLETQERTAEQMPGGEAAFGLMPLVGFRGTDLFDVSQQLAQQAIQQPPLLLKNYSNFLL